MKNETISALSVLLTIESITSLAKKIKYLKEHNTEVIQKLIEATIEEKPKVSSFPVIPHQGRNADISKLVACANKIKLQPFSANEIWRNESTEFTEIEHHFYKQVMKGKSLAGIPSTRLKTITYVDK